MKIRLVVLLLAIVAGGSITCAQQSATPRPVGVDDLFGYREAHDPQVTPDGQYVAYTVSSNSLKDDKSETRIYMLPMAGGEAIALTAEGVSSDHPRWSPDGRFLAFLSERSEGKTQVYLLNRLGGEAQRLTDTIQNVESFEWAPDSKRLVLVLRDPSQEELEAAANKGKEDGEDKAAGSGKRSKAQRPWVIDRLLFKADTVGYLDRRRTHLYVFDVASKSLTQVTSGDYDDSDPTWSPDDRSDPAWSPDGKLLAFTSNRSKPDPDATYNRDIWVVAADNKDKGEHPFQVTTHPGEKDHPSWSPDGKWITYVTSLDPKLFYYATKHVGVSPTEGGEAKILTRSLDRFAAFPRFAPDGKSIYFIADDDGTQNLCQVSLADGQITQPVGGRLTVDGYSFSKEGTLAATISDTVHPYEVFALPGGKLTRLSHLNDAWVAQFKLSPGEYVSFKSKDGTTVHGYLYKPVNYVPGKKYPTLLRPHGGPTEEYEAEFEEPAQLFAANGYVVLYPNPRGSSGYGEDFCKAIFADWGNKDYQDDVAMVDYAISQGIADPDKLGVGGHSYGGISTDFIIAQTTRFKAAISWAGVAEMTSLWGHDEYEKEYVYEFGYPWENRAGWDRVAPFYKVKNITTPTLFMGGNIDWNVPIVGGEQMYESLKALGRETELVVYPDEYHVFKTPSHIKDMYERFLAWYAHYVKADGSPARPVAPKEAKAGN